MRKEFWTWVDDLPKITAVSVPRWYFSGRETRPKQGELHIFCDANEKAYGAVAYIRGEDDNGVVTVALAASKARVAPVQPPTLPRLELLGGHLAVRLAEQIKKSLSHLEMDTYYWTDSMVSLAWIQGDASRWKQYVANRVRHIQSKSVTSEWKFVAGKENPADLCSRGVSATGLIASDCVWWRGPVWLSGHRTTWPSKEPSTTPQAAIDEESKATHSLPVIPGRPPTIFNIERYSILPRLLRLMAHVLRAFRDVATEHLGVPNDWIDGIPSAEELTRAKDY